MWPPSWRASALYAPAEAGDEYFLLGCFRRRNFGKFGISQSLPKKKQKPNILLGKRNKIYNRQHQITVVCKAECPTLISAWKTLVKPFISALFTKCLPYPDSRRILPQILCAALSRGSFVEKQFFKQRNVPKNMLFSFFWGGVTLHFSSAVAYVLYTAVFVLLRFVLLVCFFLFFFITRRIG